MNNIKNKITIFLTLLITLSSVFISTSPIHASSNLKLEATGYTYTGTSPNTGTVINHKIFKMNMDGKYVFCIESGIYTSGGGGYIPENFNSSKKDLLSKIAYYGYTMTDKTDYDYAVTQIMIWGELGDKFINTNVPNYQQRKSEIMALVNGHNTLPSWTNKEYSVEAGKSITITDTNNVISKMFLTSNTTNTNLSLSGNKLTIKADKNSTSGTITYQKVKDSEVGASIVYKKPSQQSLVEFHLDNSLKSSFKIKVIQFGDLQVKKIDELTNKPLPNTTLRFEYNGSTKDIVTDANGLAKITNISVGTNVKITEVKAPDGYFNRGEIKQVVIEANKTIEVILNNKPQQGSLNLTKLGKCLLDIESVESDYGLLNQFVFDYKPLEGVTYKIVANEDIVVGGTTHYKQGDVVATASTGADGTLINSPKLFLGKYQGIEVSAPDGFIIDETPINFELTYQGQSVELITTEATVKNEFQTLNLIVHKYDQQIQGWNENKPVIEDVKANGKVFGLFTNQEFPYNDKTLPVDSLVNYGVVTDGMLIFNDLQYPEGNYYILELDSGLNHVLDENKYLFTFDANENDTVKEIIVGKEDGSPILNELHFNNLRIKKVNEIASLTKDEGYLFDFTGNGEGAVFTLEDESGNIIQTITINKQSVGVFNNIPVGIFYLKESKTSSDDYLISNKVIRIVSTKEGIQLYDGDALLNDLDSSEITIENYLIKGKVEITKIDGNSNTSLSDARIHIYDNKMQLITIKTTDKNGAFSVSDLPRGDYYIKEVIAPKGYHLDNTPIKFSIKNNKEVVKVEMVNYRIISELPQTGDVRGATIALFGFICVSSGLGILVYKYIISRKK